MSQHNFKRRCLVCGSLKVDKCHIKTRGSGGSDEPHNLMHLCRTHHTEQHQIGIITFAKKYMMVDLYLTIHGWEIVGNKLVHKKETPTR